MSPDEALKQITIPTPCPADWDRMDGDRHARHCSACNKSVTNLAALTDAEAASLVASRGGSLCARIIRRKDGTIVTRPARFGIRSLMAWVAWTAAILGLVRFFGGSNHPSGVVVGELAPTIPVPAASAPIGTGPGNSPMSCPN